jgi:hypothetical protein
MMKAGVCDRGYLFFISWKTENRERDQKGLGTRYLQGHSSDPISPGRFHLLKFPILPKIAPPDEDLSLQNMSLWDHPYSHTLHIPLMAFFFYFVVFT